MNIYEQMLARYKSNTLIDERNASYEVMQQITLSGLYRGGFFQRAAFYGGTCLRIFHGLGRFSEDMDFSLLAPDTNFNFESYFPAIIKEFEAAGRIVEIKKKDKQNFGKVESAFLKDNTNVYDVSFQTEKSTKIKIEVDTQPPLHFSTEQKLLLQPFSFMTRCYTLSDLFAGKMHALVFRSWKHRVKGRDWYDFEWYVRNGIKLNFAHLQERILQFNGKVMSKEEFMGILKEHLATTNMNQVKADVEDFVINRQELAIWSNEYFLQISDMIQFE
ncbi:MAG: nucleotidyl transferase AbiEii/AbiGii toxin family protein [Bacteroides graminisolvens]|uniref:nucleotidyl transferase AbiEii/AbiGii toxin family protein n=1 Tax=Bacteroides graminisolvens TaxID=477666 RepID=UPI0023F358A4|nr:nucleotidyl transferase AbiEii/AbiGii toxin family protein [Bacteroides graminisolvens]MEA4886658.1 nucleotidyl transferase AbiEii/AbiGii toxin family protein [Bacteroides graminisolvens]